jgi:transcriptional regulator with XRE-family HTH domain
MPRLHDDLEYLRLSQRVRAAVEAQLHRLSWTRADLAREMRVTPGRVSQLLSGDENLTLKTLTTMASCLGTRILLDIEDLSATAAAPPVAAAAPTAAFPEQTAPQSVAQRH